MRVSRGSCKIQVFLGPPTGLTKKELEAADPPNIKISPVV